MLNRTLKDVYSGLNVKQPESVSAMTMLYKQCNWNNCMKEQGKTIDLRKTYNISNDAIAKINIENAVINICNWFTRGNVFIQLSSIKR